MLDSVVVQELHRGEKSKGSHRQLVAPGLPGSELPGKIVVGIEGSVAVEPFDIFPVAALHLAVVSGGIRTDMLHPDSQRFRCHFKGCQVMRLVC